MRPDFASAYVNLALIERDEGDSDKAMALLDRAVEADPAYAEAYAQRAVTHRLAGRFEQALEQYEKALSLSDNPVYLNGIGITFERLDRPDDAFHAYCRAIELDPSFADAYNNRANVYVKFGKHWQAEDDYKKAVRLDPQFASAYNNLGALLYDHERFEEALECYRKAFIINPKQAETCSNLAMAVKEAGDPAEAVGLYFNALALDPSLTKIHHYLAQALYDLYTAKEEDAKETAVKLAQKWKQFFRTIRSPRMSAPRLKEKRPTAPRTNMSGNCLILSRIPLKPPFVKLITACRICWRFTCGTNRRGCVFWTRAAARG